MLDTPNFKSFKLPKIFVALAALYMLSACSVFNQKAEEARQPVELNKINPSISIDRVWKASIGDGAENLGYGLQPASNGEVLYLASSNGLVSSLNALTGKLNWSTQTGVVLSSGPGVAAGRVIVASNNGDVIALDADNGNELWRSKVSGEVIAPPGVGVEQVAIRSANGTLHVLSASSGAKLWFDEQIVPTLSLRGSSAPLVMGGVILMGTDAGKIMSFSALDGAVLWERLLGLPRGTTDLDRLIDIDGPIAISESALYAVGYNSRLNKIDARSGNVVWSKEYSSNTGVGVGLENVFIANSDSHVVAINQETGSQTWKSEEYEYRELTTPISAGPAIVVGDLEGFVHFLSPQDGKTLARAKVSKSPIKRSALAANGLVYVIADDGSLAAFKLNN